MEEADAVGDLAGEAHLVGGDQHRHALGLEVADRLEDLADELGVERAGDLVEQHRPRPRRERPRDRDPLLLAAGEPVGAVVLAAVEPEAREQRPRASSSASARGTPWRADQPRMTFSSTCQVREEVVGLEDERRAGGGPRRRRPTDR